MGNELITQDNIKSRLVLYFVKFDDVELPLYLYTNYANDLSYKILKTKIKFAFEIQKRHDLDAIRIFHFINGLEIPNKYRLKPIEENNYIESRIPLGMSKTKYMYVKSKTKLYYIDIKEQLLSFLEQKYEHYKDVKNLVYKLKDFSKKQGINFDDFIDNWAKELLEATK